MASSSSVTSTPTHVQVPIAEYQALVATAAASGPSRAAIERAAALATNPDTTWFSADDVLKDIVVEGLTHVREQSGMTQSELGKLAAMPQSQVSRLESNIDAATVRVLRRIAIALKGAQPLPAPGRARKRG